jgi:hypothetical protein
MKRMKRIYADQENALARAILFVDGELPGINGRAGRKRIST